MMGKDFGPLYFRPAEVYLPAAHVDAQKWAAIACDQFTSQPEYWQKAEAFVGDAPSTLRIIYPEAYLNEPEAQADARIQSIQDTMREYMRDGSIEKHSPAFIYVQRQCPQGVREGLVGMFDLEAYDYRPGSASPIRATEQTIVERIPPRLKIRKGAPLELPHIMILIDDPMNTVIRPLQRFAQSCNPVYDVELMMGGGRLRGYEISDAGQLARIANALTGLKNNTPKDGILYAMGDGNHSLATAKAGWEAIKQTLGEAERENHPARFALAELVNIHDQALTFEPIHRVLTNVDAKGCLEMLRELAKARGMAIEPGGKGHLFYALYAGKREQMLLNDSRAMCVAALDELLNEYILQNAGAEIDYVHGEHAITELSQQPDTLAFELPAMDKAALFPLVQELGALPKKTFSMGEAEEKRYYMEAREMPTQSAVERNRQLV